MNESSLPQPFVNELESCSVKLLGWLILPLKMRVEWATVLKCQGNTVLDVHTHTGWLKTYMQRTIIVLLQYISSFRLINITTFFDVFHIDAHLLICAKC